MSSHIINREIDDVRARVNEIQRKSYRWLVIQTIVLVPSFLIPLLLLAPSSNHELYTFWSWYLVPYAIFFFLLAIYFASLLRKPQFAALYINKNDDHVSAADNALTGEQTVTQWTSARIFGLTYFAMATLFWAAILLVEADAVLATPLKAASFLGSMALSYVPLFLALIFFKDRKSTRIRYVVPVFFGLYLSAVWPILTGYGYLAALQFVFYVETFNWLNNAYTWLSWAIFLPSILVSFMLGNRVLSTTQFHVDEISAPLLQQRSVIDGVAFFPRNVQVRRSYNVMIDFDLSHFICENAGDNLGECCRQLEVELQAAGIAVDGQQRLLLCTDSPLPAGIWNCYFPSTGYYTVNLVLREVKFPRNATGSTLDSAREVLFIYKTDVKVHGFFAGSIQAFFSLLVSGVTAFIPLIAWIIQLR
jgi:hypothetical protein